MDNTRGLKDPVIKSLMQAIERHIRNETYFKEERVPLQWLKVCDRLAQDERKAMSLADFETMSAGCGVWPADVERLLELLTEVGSVMHSNEASLRKIVVTNPVEFMIGAVSKYVCDHAVHVAPEHARARLFVNEWQVRPMIRHFLFTLLFEPALWIQTGFCLFISYTHSLS